MQNANSRQGTNFSKKVNNRNSGKVLFHCKGPSRVVYVQLPLPLYAMGKDGIFLPWFKARSKVSKYAPIARQGKKRTEELKSR